MTNSSHFSPLAEKVRCVRSTVRQHNFTCSSVCHIVSDEYDRSH